MYIDVDMAVRRGLLGRIKVTLNGATIERCIASKDGPNGFVEYYAPGLLKIDPRTGEAERFKKRGNVKITISPERSNA